MHACISRSEGFCKAGCKELDLAQLFLKLPQSLTPTVTLTACRRIELLNSTTGLSFGINAACGGTCRTWGGRGPAGLDASIVDHWAGELLVLAIVA